MLLPLRKSQATGARVFVPNVKRTQGSPPPQAPPPRDPASLPASNDADSSSAARPTPRTQDSEPAKPARQNNSSATTKVPFQPPSSSSSSSSLSAEQATSAEMKLAQKLGPKILLRSMRGANSGEIDPPQRHHPSPPLSTSPPTPPSNLTSKAAATKATKAKSLHAITPGAKASSAASLRNATKRRAPSPEPSSSESDEEDIIERGDASFSDSDLHSKQASKRLPQPSQARTPSNRTTPRRKEGRSASLFPASYGQINSFLRVPLFAHKSPNGIPGILFETVDNRVVIRGFEDDYPNPQNLQVGDVVVSVNHLDARYCRCEDVLAAMTGPGPRGRSEPGTDGVSGTTLRNKVSDGIASVVFARPCALPSHESSAQTMTENSAVPPIRLLRIAQGLLS